MRLERSAGVRGDRDGRVLAVLTWASPLARNVRPSRAATRGPWPKPTDGDRREQLLIRPLIDHPALRRAMGLDTAVAAAAPAAETAPVNTSVGRGASMTAAKARRFDRRALLESAAA